MDALSEKVERFDVAGWQDYPDAMVAELRSVAGPRNVLTSASSTERFRKSFRGSLGEAVAVVRPKTLIDLWRVLQTCVKHDAVVIMQAQNTSLTDGATPDVGYDRPVVVVNTLRLDGIQLLDGGRQIVSLPGATLSQLERLLKPLGREPHSVIGSSCVGASIVGGVCNNSGGSLVRRGPAYTELSLYAQVDAAGKLELVNHLGIRLGDTPEEILTRLQNADYSPADVVTEAGPASDSGYADRVRDIDAPSAGRFNADPTHLHEASGSAGKLCVFAVRLDTFPADPDPVVYYIGTNEPAVLTSLRRLLLAQLKVLPIECEYINRAYFDACRRYGRDTFLLVHYLGAEIMPRFFALKRSLDASLSRLRFMPRNFVDRATQALSSMWPEMLPKRVRAYRNQYEHHLMLKVSQQSAEQAEAILAALLGGDHGGWFRCTQDEGERAFLNRFVAGGAVIRYRILHQKEIAGVLSLDVALRRNDDEWYSLFPPEISDKFQAQLHCAHFLCHVFHQNYVIKKGVDVAALKVRMLEHLEARGAQYPAEHNVGHQYAAKPAQVAFYRRLDPTNAMNPGIGKTTKLKNWRLANE
ncbi:D-lactate dehydrogenase [Devosia sp. CN2-171]|uniref:D-lactate dehydrogenase n=1 Tax=Devosia sp. CN2-171 TaxID=3400909 RepID=UPI003BF82F79